MASEQGKRFLDNEGFRQALVGLGTLAITGGARGTYQGLVKYQKRMQDIQDKLQEKMEKRLEKLQLLLVERSEAAAKVPTYTGEMAVLSARLKGEDGNLIKGSERLIEALYNDPSQSKEILKYVRDVEGETGFSLTPRGILDAVTVLETGDAELKNSFRSNADILESVQGDRILDNETYYQALADAMQVEKSTGYAALQFAPTPKVRTNVIGEQNQYISNAIGNLIRIDYNNPPEGTSSSDFQAMLGEMKELKSGDIPGLTPRIINRYGRPFMKDIFAQKDNNLFRDVIRMNPTYRNLFESSYSGAIEALRNDPSLAGEFDQKFGYGTSQIYLNN